jgi:hypothetical protein
MARRPGEGTHAARHLTWTPARMKNQTGMGRGGQMSGFEEIEGVN